GGPLFRARLLRLAADEHVLLLNMHHIVSDGWSVGVLFREISALYAAYRAGRPSPLAEPAVQYADYSAWQHEQLRGEVLERRLGYWRRKLAGAPSLLELPTDRPRPAVPTFRGARANLDLPGELLERVQGLARSEGVTMYMVLLGAFQVLLSRLSGSDDVVVGSPVAGRNSKDVEDLIGLFVNTLVLRTDLSGEPTFREVLRRVRDVTLGAYEHQEVPFEKLVHELQPERSLGHSPLFQVMLNLINLREEPLALDGMDVRAAHVAGLAQSKFDWTLYVAEDEGQLGLSLAYNSDLFSAERAADVVRQFGQLLDEVCRTPGERIHRLSLVTDEARAVLPSPAEPLAGWQPRESVPARVRRIAAEGPSRVALRDSAGEWSYAALDRASSSIAAALAADGIGAGKTVAIYAHRSAALVAGILGVMKSGAAFLLLDPAHPAERQLETVRQTGASGLLRLAAAGAPPEALSRHPFRRAIDIPAGLDAIAASLGAGHGDVEIDPDAVAYVLFTSGTTGRPKGIVGTHRPLLHFLEWYADTFSVGENDRFTMLSGLAHDPLLRDVLAPLWLGATLCIPDPERLAEPGWLRGWMESERVTATHLTPSMCRLLLEGTRAGTAGSLALRHACFAGEPLTRSDVAGLRAAAPDVACYNFYGATETPQAMGCFAVDVAADGAQAEVVPIGSGIRDVQLLVLNPGRRLAGVGELGEIHVRTPYLAKGYLGDDVLTAELFFPNPLSDDPSDRVYRTGDLGRYRADGAVVPAGRADLQVKVRGYRVELEEIEAVLAGHPAVAAAAARLVDDGAGEGMLAAYFVARDPHAVPADAELRDWLRARLPEYMLPAAFAPIDVLPRSASGKLDRRALPTIERGGTGPEAPRTPTEEVLAGIWSRVLGHDAVGVRDNFFALGGHSLLATRLMARVHDAFGVALPLRALFQSPTVAELAARVDEMRRAGVPALPRVVPVDRSTPPALSFAQERLWFLDRLEGGSSSYVIPLALRLSGALRRDALERALNEIVRRHESLRTTFHEVEGGPIPMVAPHEAFALVVDDLTGVDAAEREAEAKRRAAEEARRPFDLAAGPLFRPRLLRLADGEHVLLLYVHHIVSDGSSTGLLLRELSALYEAYAAGGESPLPELGVQYGDYAIWQREQLRGEVLERRLSYWRGQLAGAPALLELPTDRPRPAVQSYRGAREGVEFSGELLDRLQALGRSEGATLYMVMLGAFQLLLGRYSGSDDVVVGSPIAGRTTKE
ncbi:MAG TPA: amino acid adenylation domain-containing protein, partial [Longimicrobium sp.]